MSYRGHVYSNLMRSAAVQLDFEQGELTYSREYAPIRARSATSTPLCGHPRPPANIPGNWKINAALCLSHASVNECDVNFFHFPGEELSGERAMSGVIARDDDRAGCAAIQPMHDSRPLGARSSGKISKAIQQSIHKRAAMVARACVDNHVCRFVHDDHVGVFVQNFNGDVFRCGGERRAGNNLNLGAFAFEDLVGGTCRASRDEHMAFRDQFLNSRPAELREPRDKKAVQPLAGVFRADAKMLDPWWRWSLRHDD